MNKPLIIVALSAFSINLSAQDIENIPTQPEAQPVVDNPVQPQAVAPTIIRETVSFGYLSYDKVIKSMDEYKDAQAAIAELRKAYEAELAHSEEVFSRQFSEYIEGQKSFPENILLKRQKELQQTMEQTLQFKQEAKAMLDKKEKEIMDSLRIRLDKVIGEIGIERGYAFVINTDNNTYPFINAGLGEDITSTVLNRLKNK